MFGKRKKHQVRIQHQTPSSSKRKISIFILLILIAYTFFNIYQKNDPATNSDTPSENQKGQPTLTDKDIQKQIQKDYKANLLKRQMTKDEVRHKKKYIPNEISEDSKEDYSLKDGVHLSQDKSFDDLLSAIKIAEEETEEDIEDRIARYRIIDEQIQKSFQGQHREQMQRNFQEQPQDNTSETIDPKKTFAQEFIENARKGGYKVQLDDNLKVKSVKKIKPNSNDEALFIEEAD